MLLRSPSHPTARRLADADDASWARPAGHLAEADDDRFLRRTERELEQDDLRYGDALRRLALAAR